MKKVSFWQWVGIVWSLPITLLCFLFYVGPAWALGWYKYVGTRDLALLWLWTDKVPGWLKKLWGPLWGTTMGNMIVMRYDPDAEFHAMKVLVHEQRHVAQCMRFGIFQPIIYWICSGAANLLWDVDPYHDNIFEIDAYNHADKWEAEHPREQ